MGLMRFMGEWAIFLYAIALSKEFTLETFKEGIDYAHALNKKVYATINGFPFNSQLKLLEEHIYKMAELKPDAFIIAAPGVIKLAQKSPRISLSIYPRKRMS